MTNKSRTTFYIGVTNNLTRRVTQHRTDDVDGFTSRYNCSRLVYFEHFSDPSAAISREKQVKRWRREKKAWLISMRNPALEDLAQTVLGLGPAPKNGSDNQPDG